MHARFVVQNARFVVAKTGSALKVLPILRLTRGVMGGNKIYHGDTEDTE